LNFTRRNTPWHGYASTLIAQNLNVVFVSRQLSHADPNVTLGVYAHLFQHADDVTAARHALQSSYQAIHPHTPPNTARDPNASPRGRPMRPATSGNDSGNNRTLMRDKAAPDLPTGGVEDRDDQPRSAAVARLTTKT
jgi:hypothetical protein